MNEPSDDVRDVHVQPDPVSRARQCSMDLTCRARSTLSRVTTSWPDGSNSESTREFLVVSKWPTGVRGITRNGSRSWNGTETLVKPLESRPHLEGTPQPSAPEGSATATRTGRRTLPPAAVPTPSASLRNRWPECDRVNQAAVITHFDLLLSLVISIFLYRGPISDRRSGHRRCAGFHR